MMSLRERKVLFVVLTSILTLLAASPAFSRFLVYPRTEFFTELWLLGPNHKAENYPHNITRNANYDIYLGLSNQLGYCAYYVVEVKFRNATQPAPTSFGPIENRKPSNLTSLYNITAFVPDKGKWELLITFSFDYSYNSSQMQISFHNVSLNGRALNIMGEFTAWNATRRDFFGDLLFETYVYNTTSSVFQFHGRSVDLKFNMTA